MPRDPAKIRTPRTFLLRRARSTLLHARCLLISACLLVFLSVAWAQPESKPTDSTSKPPFDGLNLRLLGPAVTSGRVVSFAVHPRDRAHYYVAAASGGVWKTTNAGTTWTPVFDNEGSYSIGCVTLDPKNP